MHARSRLLLDASPRCVHPGQGVALFRSASYLHTAAVGLFRKLCLTLQFEQAAQTALSAGKAEQLDKSLVSGNPGLLEPNCIPYSHTCIHLCKHVT